MPEFQETQIPAIARKPEVHNELHALLAQRNAIELLFRVVIVM
jgi:hypothetical protein